MFNTFIFDTQWVLCNKYFWATLYMIYLLNIFGDDIMTRNVILVRSINAGETMKSILRELEVYKR